MTSQRQFRFRFQRVAEKVERDKQIAEMAWSRCLERVKRLQTEIAAQENNLERLAQAWAESLKGNSVASIESRLVFHKHRQELSDLQSQLTASQIDSEKHRQSLQAIAKRLRCLEMIREQDLTLFKRHMKHRTEREVLEMVLAKYSTQHRNGVRL